MKFWVNLTCWTLDRTQSIITQYWQLKGNYFSKNEKSELFWIVNFFFKIFLISTIYWDFGRNIYWQWKIKNNSPVCITAELNQEGSILSWLFLIRFVFGAVDQSATSIQLCSQATSDLCCLAGNFIIWIWLYKMMENIYPWQVVPIYLPFIGKPFQMLLRITLATGKAQVFFNPSDIYQVIHSLKATFHCWYICK